MDYCLIVGAEILSCRLRLFCQSVCVSLGNQTFPEQTPILKVVLFLAKRYYCRIKFVRAFPRRFQEVLAAVGGSHDVVGIIVCHSHVELTMLLEFHMSHLPLFH